MAQDLPASSTVRPRHSLWGRWFTRLSLRVQITVLVALVVTLVVTASAYLQIRAFEATILADLLETARGTAQAVADSIELQRDPLNAEVVADTLREFIEAVPSIRVISAVTLVGSEPVVIASTSSRVKGEALAIAARVMERKATLWDGTGAIRTVAVPVLRRDRIIGAVVLSFSASAVDEVHRRGRAVVFWFVPAAVVILTLLVNIPLRRLIHTPVAGITKTMERVAAGDLGARAPVVRQDELGAIAAGLNSMLQTMEHFNVELQQRIEEATRELREKNEALVESYQRVFALREALTRAQQMAAVGQFAASVAHQVGTPLNLISGHVQLIMEQAAADPAVVRRLEIVQEQIAKVTSIVRTLLDRTRHSAPRVPTDVTELVRRVAEVARPKLVSAGVTLDLQFEEYLPQIMADGVQLELALLNLVSNSLDAMPAGGTAVLTVSRTPSGVRIEVADTGSGIPVDLLPRIFEPWVTTKTAGKGTGLGLSITRDVVTAHGGTIAAANRAGGGAIFTIELPAAGEASACRAS